MLTRFSSPCNNIFFACDSISLLTLWSHAFSLSITYNNNKNEYNLIKNNILTSIPIKSCPSVNWSVKRERERKSEWGGREGGREGKKEKQRDMVQCTCTTSGGSKALKFLQN